MVTWPVSARARRLSREEGGGQGGVQLLLSWFQFPSPPGWEEVDSKTPSVAGALFVCWPISGQTPVEREWKGPGLNGGLWVGLGFGGRVGVGCVGCVCV